MTNTREERIADIAAVISAWMEANENDMKRTVPRVLRGLLFMLDNEVRQMPNKSLNVGEIIGVSALEVKRLRRILPRFAPGKTRLTLTALADKLEKLVPADWEDDSVGKCFPVYANEGETSGQVG